MHLSQAEMVGHYLAEFSMTYKPSRHGRPGVGGKKFVPLK
jgi:small subunit ribosomal protein S15e